MINVNGVAMPPQASDETPRAVDVSNRNRDKSRLLPVARCHSPI